MRFRSIMIASLALILLSAMIGYLLYGRSIEATLQRHNNPCPLDAPIAVTIRNWTPFTIHRTHFQMEAWEGARTENLLSSGLFGYNASRKINPFSSETICYSDSFFTSPIKHSHENTSLGRVKLDTNSIVREVDWFREKIEGIEIHTYDAQYINLD